MILAIALGVLGASTVGLFFLVEPAVSWYFQLAWWAYVAAVDDLNRRLAGRSLIRDSPRRFAWLALGSVAWWTLFEAINLRLGNWYYVMDPAERWVRWTAGVVAFATVLPAILETLELVENLGWLRSVRVPRLRWGPGKEAGMLALGAGSLVLPLAWPDLFYPLTWGSFAFLLAPWNRRRAARSFLRDLEHGEAGALCRTLLAGLLCGVLWETWNYWARTKWIYTVPGFERLKLFEMPLLGFLGFPPFAVECVVVIRFVHCLASRWPARGVRSRAAAAALVASATAATAAVFPAADAVTVESFYVPVARLELLPAADRERLSAAGLECPEELLRALGTPAGLQAWSARTGIDVDTLERVRSRVALVMHRGLGQRRALQLARLGVDGLEDLAAWDAGSLAAALREQGSAPRDRFLERRARVWLQGLPSRSGLVSVRAGTRRASAPGRLTPEVSGSGSRRGSAGRGGS